MEPEIRRLQIEDHEVIVRLWTRSGLPYKPNGRDGRDKMAAELANPDVAAFGLFAERDLLAVGLANYDGRRGWINRVAVHPDHRGKGLARRIIDACEQFLRSRGAVVICALIEETNSPSMAAFEKAGYSCLDNIKYFAKRDSADS
jgi:N-acetylglutamate synthase